MSKIIRSRLNRKNLIKKILSGYILTLSILMVILVSICFTVCSATIDLFTNSETNSSDSVDCLQVSDDSSLDSTDYSIPISSTTASPDEDLNSVLYSPSSSDCDSNSVSYNSSVSVDYLHSTSYNSSYFFNDTEAFDQNSLNNSKDLQVTICAISNERIVPFEEIVTISENKLGNLSIEKEKHVILEDSTDIDNIKFTPSENLNDVKITIIHLKEKPEVITEPQKENISVYKYLDIKLTANDEYIEEKEVKSLKFKFKVEYDWIKENNIDKITIILIRFHDGEWQNLSTTLINEDEKYVYYEAESPGCSTFAIVGSKVIEKHESYISEESSIPWSIIIAVIISLTIILIAVLIKARYIYVE